MDDTAPASQSQFPKVDEPYAFSARELTRLAAYRGAVVAGVYNEGRGTESIAGFCQWQPASSRAAAASRALRRGSEM